MTQQAIEKGIMQIVTSSLHNQYTLDASVASIVLLNNISQSRGAVIKNLIIGDGVRTLALVIESLKIIHFEMNSAALNFISVVTSNDQIRKICLEKGALDFIGTNDFKQRFVNDKTRNMLRHKKFQERINRCIKMLSIQSEEELLLLETQLLEKKIEEDKKYYIEANTGRRMLIGLTGKNSPK